MTDNANTQNPAETDGKKAKAKPVNRQKFTEAELKRLGLDPTVYGFKKGK